MKKRKLSIILIISLTLIILLKIFFKNEQVASDEQKTIGSKTLQLSLKEKLANKSNLSTNVALLEQVQVACKRSVNIQNDETRLLWFNIHIQLPSGVVQRIRVFNEDGENGSFRKLVLFQEDEDGFPVKLELNESESINPSLQTINKYKSRGQIIYNELATSTIINNATELFLQTIDGKIKKKYLEGPTGRQNCLTSKL